MTTKSFLSNLWKFIVLVVSLIILVTLVQSILPKPKILSEVTSQNPLRELGSLFFVYGLYALFCQFIAVKSEVTGFKLLLTICVVYIGVGSVMTQLETIIFNQAFPSLPPRDVLLLVLNTAVVGLIFAVLVVSLCKRWKSNINKTSLNERMMRNQWPVIVWAAIVYPIIYFCFGYFVAYGNQEVLEFYNTTQITQNNITLILLQIIRGGMWGFIGILISNLFKRPEHIIFSITGCFVIFTSMGLVFKNPVMPEAVRYAHGFELSTSMLIFGLFLSLYITNRRVK